MLGTLNAPIYHQFIGSRPVFILMQFTNKRDLFQSALYLVDVYRYEDLVHYSLTWMNKKKPILHIELHAQHERDNSILDSSNILMIVYIIHLSLYILYSVSKRK